MQTVECEGRDDGLPVDAPSHPSDKDSPVNSATGVSEISLTPTAFFFCRLGDMVMLTRMLNLLHRRFRRPCQVIGTGSWTPAIFAGNPDVKAVWAFHRHLPFLLDGAWPSMRRALLDSDPGPVYICERHYRQLPRIRRMLRLSGINPRRCVFLTDLPVIETEHVVDRLLKLGARTPEAFRAADFPVPSESHLNGPRLYVLETERVARDARLRAQGWAGRELILVQPGNHRSMGPRRARWRRLNSDDKWWPLERWAELLHLINRDRPDAHLLLRGSREEVPMLQEILAVTKLASAAAVGTDLRQLFALCEVASSMISVDTGPAHAAAALSVPLVVLYGVHSPQHWLPRSPDGSPVVGVGGPPMYQRVDQVPVDAVFRAWRSVSTH
jgi:ADP-heptose:LPS heptosyltransferase